MTRGETAPDFTLPDIQGNEFTLSKHSREGKATLILVWGVWCPYCREIMVNLTKLYKKFHKKGLKIITVSIRESPRKVAIFTNKLNPEFTVLVDEWGDLKNKYCIKDVPLVIILNSDRTVKDVAITTSVEKVKAMVSNAVKN